jgi:hypothetical protein
LRRLQRRLCWRGGGLLVRQRHCCRQQLTPRYLVMLGWARYRQWVLLWMLVVLLLLLEW